MSDYSLQINSQMRHTQKTDKLVVYEHEIVFFCKKATSELKTRKN